MDIEELKEALGDEKFTELETYVNDLTGQRDAARNESIKGRKGLKEKLTALEAQQADLLEKLGVESFDDIEDMPDAKGLAEASKQFETKIKRLERELATANEAKGDLESKYRDSRMKSVVAEALGAHEFLAPDVVSSFIGGNLTWEDDELLFRQDDGNMVSVKDGVSAFAKSRPELLKAKGTGGAGTGTGGAGGSGGQKTVTRVEFDAMAQGDRAAFFKDGGQIAEH